MTAACDCVEGTGASNAATITDFCDVDFNGNGTV